jgi:hypothetical protein
MRTINNRQRRRSGARKRRTKLIRPPKKTRVRSGDIPKINKSVVKKRRPLAVAIQKRGVFH